MQSLDMAIQSIDFILYNLILNTFIVLSKNLVQIDLMQLEKSKFPFAITASDIF